MRIDKAFRIVDFIIRLAETKVFSLRVTKVKNQWVVITDRRIAKAGKTLLAIRDCEVKDLKNNESMVI